MHVRNVLDYFRRRMKELGIIRYRWEEEFISFPVSPAVGVYRYEFHTTNYFYLLDNWVQARTFFDVAVENNLQVLGDYSFRRYQGMSRQFRQHGINEFTGRIQFRFELNVTNNNESQILVPFIKVIPIQAL